jgi:hypothetical protein
MGLSKELQMGKIGEHLVCADLLSQGYNAFLTDQGLPYDICVDYNGKIYKVQVKCTLKRGAYKINPKLYQFNTKKGKGSYRRFNKEDIDCMALVALDIKCIAYIHIQECISPHGEVKGQLRFDTKQDPEPMKIQHYRRHGYWDTRRHIEDYGNFKRILTWTGI